MGWERSPECWGDSVKSILQSRRKRILEIVVCKRFSRFVRRYEQEDCNVSQNVIRQPFEERPNSLLAFHSIRPLEIRIHDSNAYGNRVLSIGDDLGVRMLIFVWFERIQHALHGRIWMLACIDSRHFTVSHLPSG